MPQEHGMTLIRKQSNLPALFLAAVAALAAAVAFMALAAPAHARLIAGDDQFTCQAAGDLAPFMRAHRATVVRIIVPYGQPSSEVACARIAAAEGYRVYVTLQYSNAWSTAKVADYVRSTLAKYARYAWAVSVGNEQDLFQARGGSGRSYRAVWNAVEPIIARHAPHAIRVFGEVSPFGFSFLKTSFSTGRPVGAQAIAFHCYNTKTGGLRAVPQVAAWAATWRLPLWCSEMSGALSHTQVHPWLVHDSQTSWDALLTSVERRSPNLQMISYYRWPEIGAL
jgi:hypothetical protein